MAGRMTSRRGVGARGRGPSRGMAGGPRPPRQEFDMQGLADVVRVSADCAILRSAQQEGDMDIYLHASTPAFNCKDLTKMIQTNDRLYFQADGVLQQVEGCSFIARRACCTVSGIGKVSMVQVGYGYLESEQYGKVFFHGSAVTEQFGGPFTLQAYFRPWDELRFVGWDSRNFENRDPPGRSFKAEEISLPLMYAHGDPARDKWGFVVKVWPSEGGVLFCKPVGKVFVFNEDLTPTPAGGRGLQIGDRLAFATVAMEPRRYGCRYRAIQTVKCQDEFLAFKSRFGQVDTTKGGFPSASGVTTSGFQLDRSAATTVAPSTVLQDAAVARQADIGASGQEKDNRAEPKAPSPLDDWEEIEKELENIEDDDEFQGVADSDDSSDEEVAPAAPISYSQAVVDSGTTHLRNLHNASQKKPPENLWPKPMAKTPATACSKPVAAVQHVKPVAPAPSMPAYAAQIRAPQSFVRPQVAPVPMNAAHIRAPQSYVRPQVVPMPVNGAHIRAPQNYVPPQVAPMPLMDVQIRAPQNYVRPHESALGTPHLMLGSQRMRGAVLQPECAPLRAHAPIRPAARVHPTQSPVNTLQQCALNLGSGPATRPPVATNQSNMNVGQRTGIAEANGLSHNLELPAAAGVLKETRETQTENKMKEEDILIELLDDQEIMAVMCQKYPDMINKLML